LQKSILANLKSPDIYLLDDPTSSLDNKTIDKIMWNLKNKEELKDKTFVITTNDMNLLHFAD
jgi:ATP-binding cassette, subfamily C, bacterial CydD